MLLWMSIKIPHYCCLYYNGLAQLPHWNSYGRTHSWSSTTEWDRNNVLVTEWGEGMAKGLYALRKKISFRWKNCILRSWLGYNSPLGVLFFNLLDYNIPLLECYFFLKKKYRDLSNLGILWSGNLHQHPEVPSTPPLQDFTIFFCCVGRLGLCHQMKMSHLVQKVGMFFCDSRWRQ